MLKDSCECTSKMEHPTNSLLTVMCRIEKILMDTNKNIEKMMKRIESNHLSTPIESNREDGECHKLEQIDPIPDEFEVTFDSGDQQSINVPPSDSSLNQNGENGDDELLPEFSVNFMHLPISTNSIDESSRKLNQMPQNEILVENNTDQVAVFSSFSNVNDVPYEFDSVESDFLQDTHPIHDEFEVTMDHDFQYPLTPPSSASSNEKNDGRPVSSLDMIHSDSSTNECDFPVFGAISPISVNKNDAINHNKRPLQDATRSRLDDEKVVKRLKVSNNELRSDEIHKSRDDELNQPATQLSKGCEDEDEYGTENVPINQPSRVGTSTANNNSNTESWDHDTTRPEYSDPHEHHAQFQVLTTSTRRSFGRRKLYRIISENELDLITRKVMENELQRHIRLIEQEKSYSSLLQDILEDSFQSRLILDIDKSSKKVRVEVNRELVKDLKPHQREGIKFMYNSIIENVDRIEEAGSGCVLAHCMGSGKSFQIIALLHTLLTNQHTRNHIKRVLLTFPTPHSLIWKQEFDKWISSSDMQMLKVYQSRNFDTLQEWVQNGGIFLINHSSLEAMMRICESNEFHHFAHSDLVIIDESHLVTGQVSSWYSLIQQMKTKRKILVTGNPIYYDLDRYYKMIHLVKPRLLGTHETFVNRFRNPIVNGQQSNSTENDVLIMEQQIIELNKLTCTFIQRYGPDTLDLYIEPKHEYAIFIRPTDEVAKLYNECLDHFNPKVPTQLLHHYKKLVFCMNHPATFWMSDRKSKHPDDDDSKNQNWYKSFTKPDGWKNIEASGKFNLFFKILSECLALNEKLVVVTQSPKTLDLIEKNLNHHLNWKQGKEYYRVQKLNHRRMQEMVVFNNRSDTTKRLMLLTKVFAIGHNLIGANRIIIFDVSINPIDDLQAISSLHRLGQVKPVYVYRFITVDTTEELAFHKQMGKLKMISSIVDQNQVRGSLVNFDATKFYQKIPSRKEYQVCLPLIPDDQLLTRIINNENHGILNCVKVDPLLVNGPHTNSTNLIRCTGLINKLKNKK